MKYLIQIEERDTYTNTRKRYYMREASDTRRPAVVDETVARHLVANIGNDFRYLRNATAVALNAVPMNDAGRETLIY